jgi:putative oxidoreductase
MHMLDLAHQDEFAAALMLLARALLSAPFLYSGIDKLLRWNAAQAEVAKSGLPFPTFLHAVTVIIQLGAGLSVLIGIDARVGAVALCLFLVPVTVLYHPFWKQTGEALVAEADHFLLNLALIGGLLIIAAVGGGRMSVIDQPNTDPIRFVATLVGSAQ